MGGMIQCICCDEVLHSLSRHDFQQCGCDCDTFVDGGEDYMRVGGECFNDIVAIPHVHLAGNLGVMLLDDA